MGANIKIQSRCGQLCHQWGRFVGLSSGSNLSSKSFYTRTKCLLVSLLASTATAACATSPVSDGLKDSDAGLKLSSMPVQDEVIVLESGRLPKVTLTPDILYKLLAAEFAAQRGGFMQAGETYLELARFTGDVRLAQRAVEFFMLIGNYPGALDSVNAWLLIEPDNEDAKSMRLALMAALGQTDGLVDALVQHVKGNEDKTEALAQVMGILDRMQDRDEALQIIEQVIEKSGQKGTMPGYMATADLARSAKRFEQAFEQAKLALKLDPESEDAAMRVLDYGFPVKPEEAVKTARDFARKHPSARRLRLMLAGSLADQGKIDDAVEELRLMSADFPEDFDLLFIRAQFAAQTGRLAEANRLLNEYIEVQKQRQNAVTAGASDATGALTDAYTLLASIAEKQGQYDKAVEILGRIDDPNATYSARLRQAKIRADQGRIDEAIRMIDAAHPADQDEQLIGVLTLVQILRQAERYDQAIERLLEADKDIRDSVEIKYELGMLYERKKDLDAMEKYLRQVIELDPGYAHAYNALGYSLADRNVRLDEAYDLISQAHQLLPNDPYILDSLGWVRYRQGDLKQAQTFLRQAFDLRPEPEIAAHLGEVLWVQGDHEQAREIWRKGLEINPKDQLLIDVMKKFGVKP